MQQQTQSLFGSRPRFSAPNNATSAIHVRASCLYFFAAHCTAAHTQFARCIVFFLAIPCHDVVTIPLEDFQTWINMFEDREGVDMVVVRSRGTGLQVRIVDGGE